MIRPEPHSDLVVYSVVIGTVLLIMLGKYLIGKGASE